LSELEKQVAAFELQKKKDIQLYLTAMSGTGFPTVYGSDYLLIAGSCLDAIKALPDSSINLICVDVPYDTDNSPPSKTFSPTDKQYQNLLWPEAELRTLLLEGTRVLCKGGKQLIFCNFFTMEAITKVVTKIPSLVYDAPYTWTRPKSVASMNDRSMAKKREFYDVEYILVVYERGTVKQSDAFIGRGSDGRNLGKFPPSGVARQIKHADLYRELLGRYKKGMVLDYCMGTGICGKVALEMGFQFVGVEIHAERFEDAKISFESSFGAADAKAAEKLRLEKKIAELSAELDEEVYKPLAKLEAKKTDMEAELEEMYDALMYLDVGE